MIDYPSGALWKLVCKRHGSVIPKALVIAIPSTIFAAFLVLLDDQVSAARDTLGLSANNSTVLWAAVTAPLFTMIAFRTSGAWGRFWEGTSLLHAMRGEWFDSASCLATFTVGTKNDKAEAVSEFRHTLLRLMSLCHGSALDELKDEETEQYEVLDIKGLDESTLKILMECKAHRFNRVEVLLHMIQVLVINAQKEGTINVPPPILSRIYQTLSRGFVNLLNAKKIKDTKFPFPYAQVIAVLLLLLSVITPVALSTMIPHVTLCAVSTFVPVFGLLCLNYAAEELEMPFGEDPNDLPLSHFQEEMNSSLLMLIHDWSDHLAKTNDNALRDWESLSHCLHHERDTLQKKCDIDVHRGRKKSIYALKTSVEGDNDSPLESEYVSPLETEYQEWTDRPASSREGTGSVVASADVAENDVTVGVVHASETVTQPSLPVSTNTRQPQDSALNKPGGGNHGERVHALLSAAMNLPRPAETGGQPGRHPDSNELCAVGISVNSDKPPQANLPASPPGSLASSSCRGHQHSPEQLGTPDECAGGFSRWKQSVTDTVHTHKPVPKVQTETSTGILGGYGGQLFPGFGSYPSLPTKDM